MNFWWKFRYNYTNPSNPRVYLDVTKGKDKLGRLVFELYHNHAPKTVANFQALCTGHNDKKLKYAHSPFHRVIQGFMAQGGDVVHHDGSGNDSIYGDRFADENLSKIIAIQIYMILIRPQTL